MSNNLNTTWGPANGTGLVSVEFTFGGEAAAMLSQAYVAAWPRRMHASSRSSAREKEAFNGGTRLF